MKKMMYLTIDTEACSTKYKGKVSPIKALTYDIGWIIHDKAGIVVKKRSFIVAEIFFGEKYRYNMETAYFHEKIPSYLEKIAKGEIFVAPIAIIHKIFLKDVTDYKVKAVIAYNAVFDRTALNNTIREITNHEISKFYDGEWWCSWKMAKAKVAKTPTYKKFCEKNNYITEKGNYQTTAEIMYRYLTKNTDFIEAHTGLEDVMIEKEIFAYIIRKKQKIEPWEKVLGITKPKK